MAEKIREQETGHVNRNHESDVVRVPCSKATFPDTDLSRRLLYVAISRASHKLLIVASKKNSSPLFLI